MKKSILTIVCYVLILTLGLPASVSLGAAGSVFDKEVTIYIGEKTTIDIGKPATEIIWKSENETIVKVDDSGLITPVSVGSTNIIATYKKTDYLCRVNVQPAYLSQTEVEVFPFEYFELSIVGTKIKKWKVTDDSIISLPRSVPSSDSFRLRALAEGDTILTITGKNKKNYKCHVIVKPCTYKASYYDKKKTNIKNISYFVDGKLTQYDSYKKNNALDYSIKYFYEEGKYIEYQEGPNGLIIQTIYDYNDNVIGEIFDQTKAIKTDYNRPNYSNWYYVFENDYYYKYSESDWHVSKTFYDYNDNVIREIEYFNENTIENPKLYISSEKYVDENGNWHFLTNYRYIKSENDYRPSDEKEYNKDMILVGETKYDRKTGEKEREYIYFPEDGKLASDTSYIHGAVIKGVFYNQNPYFKNREIDYPREIFFDFSGRVVRVITYDENNNIISDIYQ